MDVFFVWLFVVFALAVCCVDCNEMVYLDVLREKKGGDVFVRVNSAVLDGLDSKMLDFFEEGKSRGFFDFEERMVRRIFSRALKFVVVREEFREAVGFELRDGFFSYVDLKVGFADVVCVRSVSERSKFGFYDESVVVSYVLRFVPNELGVLMLEFDVGGLPVEGDDVLEDRLVRFGDGEPWDIWMS